LAHVSPQKQSIEWPIYRDLVLGLSQNPHPSGVSAQQLTKAFQAVDYPAVILALIPFAAFALAFLTGAIALWIFIRNAQVRNQVAGQALHFGSRFVTVDIKPKSEAEPELAGVPVYPGALRCQPAAATYQLDVALGSKHFHSFTASYWTPDPVQRVWEFYRRELQDWSVDPDNATGYQIVTTDREKERKIRVYRERDRTCMDISVSTR